MEYGLKGGKDFYVLFTDSIMEYAFECKKPDKLDREALEYFNTNVAPKIDEARAEWREYDRRRAQFYAAIEGVPENVRRRYETDFYSSHFASEQDFLDYLDEISADINAIRQKYGNNG